MLAQTITAPAISPVVIKSSVSTPPSLYRNLAKLQFDYALPKRFSSIDAVASSDLNQEHVVAEINRNAVSTDLIPAVLFIGSGSIFSIAPEMLKHCHKHAILLQIDTNSFVTDYAKYLAWRFTFENAHELETGNAFQSHPLSVEFTQSQRLDAARTIQYERQSLGRFFYAANPDRLAECKRVAKRSHLVSLNFDIRDDYIFSRVADELNQSGVQIVGAILSNIAQHTCGRLDGLISLSPIVHPEAPIIFSHSADFSAPTCHWQRGLAGLV